MSNSLRNVGRTMIYMLIGIVLLGSCTSEAYDPSSVPQFETPVFLTTAGQSIDWETVNILLRRLGIDYDYDNLATPADLAGVNTLIVVPAHSNKGLGSAGIDVDGEMERIKALLAEASKLEMSVVLIHAGGEIRRGAYSDPFIDEVMKYTEYAVVWEPGNGDGYFTKNCTEQGIPLTLIDKVAGLNDVLKLMFGE